MQQKVACNTKRSSFMTNHITIDGRTIDSALEFERTDGHELAYEAALLDFFRNEEKIPLSKLAKYYLNENLNFLCGSGTSVAIMTMKVTTQDHILIL